MRVGNRRRNLLRWQCGRAVVLALFAAHSALARAQADPAGDAPPAAPPQRPLPPSRAPAAPKPPETPPIIITGSRIPRTNLTAVSPVTMVKNDEVKLEGATFAEELLNQLPQITPDQGVFTSNGASGTSTVVLRGLGAGRTLVLINGRRLGPGDPESLSADINTIPSSLIQRVEVLTGGASSVYGSDAIAGVVNFIMDTRLDGFRIDGQTSVFQHDNRGKSGILPLLEDAGIRFPRGSAVDAGRQDINAAFGRALFDGRLHATIYAGYRKSAQLTQDRRDYSACTIMADLDDNTIGCGGSSVSYPGTFVTNFGPFKIGPDQTFVPGRVSYNYAPLNFYQRPDRRVTAGGFADFAINDALRPYAELMWMDDRSLAQIAPSGDFGNTGNVNCDNPLLSDQQRATICANGNFLGQQVVVDDDGNIIAVRGTPRPFIDPVTGATYFRARLSIRRRGVESGGRQEDLRHKALRVVGGAKGDLGRGIAYDASYVSNDAKSSKAHLNDFSITRLRRAIDVVADPASGQPVCRSVLTGEDPSCVPWNVFAIGGVTPEATAYLNVPSFRRGQSNEQIANANATIDVGQWGLRSPWAEEPPALNFGAEYRKDSIEFKPDELSLSGDLAGQGFAQLPIHGSTAVKELFIESRIPLITGRLVERLAFEGGYRQSWYTNAESGFSTDAYKLALDLTAVRGVRLRASQQRAVRAPNLLELFYPTQRGGFSEDPCAGPTPRATAAQCAQTGVSPAQYGQILALPAGGAFDSYNEIYGGNPGLAPETAKTRTVGVVLEPRFLPGLAATVDWWDIDLKGAVEWVGGDTIMATCIATGDPIFCSRIHRDSEGSLWLSDQGYIDDRNANIGSLRTKGIDFGVNFHRSLGHLGSAALEFNGTKVLKWIIDNGGLAKPYDCAGLYGYQCGIPTPSWRHTARLTWETRAGLALSLHWRRIGKMTLADASGRVENLGFSEHDRILRAYDYFDFSALFHVQKNYALRFGVNNLFDREPPVLTSNLGACWQGCNGNTYPQWYDPLGRFVFAGITVNLKPF